MDSSLLPIIADLVLQDLEQKALNSINLNLPFYYIHVNDIILTLTNQITSILNIFNSFYNRLQFMLEQENNRR